MNEKDLKAEIARRAVERLGNPEQLAFTRGLNFAGAGANLALVLLIAQIQAADLALSAALIFAAGAIPIWIAMAVSMHFLVLLGVPYSRLCEQKRFRLAERYAYWTAVGLTGAAIWCVLFHLLPLAAVVYSAAIAASVLVLKLLLLPIFTLFILREKPEFFFPQRDGQQVEEQSD